MIRCILLVSIVLFVTSCSNHEEAIKTTLHQICNFENPQTVINHLDKESIKYFTEMADVALNAEDADIQEFCRLYPNPLATRYMLQSLAMLSKKGEDAAPLELSEIITLAALVDFGPVGMENKTKYSFHEIEEYSRDKVVAILKFKSAPRTYIQSKVPFQKEGDVWKMNYPATVTFFDKYLKKLQSKYSGSDRDFIQAVIENGGKEVQFRYQK